MRSSAIRHPENDYFIRRHGWQIRALETPLRGNKIKRKDSHAECAAEIMSIMEYHFNNRLANRLLRGVIEKVLQTKEKRNLVDLGDWMPYSVSYLHELLLGGRAIRVIEPALLVLIDRRFVSADVPVSIKKAYYTTAKWYRLNVDIINDWIDKNCDKTWIDDWKKPREREIVAKVDPADAPNLPAAEIKQMIESKAQRFERMENTVFSFYAHVHAKNNNFLFDKIRRGKVKNRLKEGRSMELCIMAVLGNLFSDYHQGRHKDNLIESGGKIYDDIELIFRNAVNFEKHVGYAEQGGVTEEIALKDLEAFLATGTSRYAKRMAKTDPERYQEQTEARQQPKDAARYREFAMNIAAFFTSEVNTREIIELTTVGTGDLVAHGKGLTESWYLEKAIAQATRTFRDQGPNKSMSEAIAKFSEAFTRMQNLNIED